MIYLALLLVSATDIRYRIIPKRIIYLASAFIPLLGGIEKMAWAATLFLSYCFIFRLFRGALGFGDVRLAPLAVFVADSYNPLLVHGLAWFSAAIFLLGKRRVNMSLPFAPFFSLSLLFLLHL